MASSSKNVAATLRASNALDAEYAEKIAALKIDEKNITAESHISTCDPTNLSSSDSITAKTIKERPMVIVLIGLAGVGKTTLTDRLISTLTAEGKPPYVVNLDPACFDPPYPVNVDIRDSIDYTEIMDKYGLGPNGSIVTALNIFATKVEQLTNLLVTKPLKSTDYIIIDTPGQIEVFVWSAGGQIILQGLGVVFRTAVLYVNDLVATTDPITFISNMTYACSILFKSQLPMILVLNKADCDIPSASTEFCQQRIKGQVEGDDEATTSTSNNDQAGEQNPKPCFAEEWIEDFESYEKAISEHEGFAANLGSSLCLALDEFYRNIEHATVSARTGLGMRRLFDSIGKAFIEYEKVFLPLFEKLKKRAEKERKRKSNTKEELAEIAKSMTTNIPSKKSKFLMKGGGGAADSRNIAYSDAGSSSSALFSLSASSAAAQGFSLTMGTGLDSDDDEDTSSDDDEDGSDATTDDDEADKQTFKEFYAKEMGKRVERQT